jgi:aminoglycoside phosphotransferase (APT) family kinase protein
MENLSEDLLRLLAAHHLSVSPDEVALYPTSTGKYNTTSFVSTANGEYVLRVAPPDDAWCVFYERRMMAQEPAIHNLLLQCTSVPVAEIVVHDASRKLIDRDYLLMRRLDGFPLTQHPDMTNDMYAKVLFQVGECLHQMHQQTAQRYGYLGEHHPMEPATSWLEAFGVMWGNLITDIENINYYTPEEGDWMRELLVSHVNCFERSVTSRLLHMDIWAENILANESGDVTGLVDFDRALWGDREIEFAVLDYCGISHPSFWDGYGEERDTSEEAMIRQRFYLLYELQKYIGIRSQRNGRTDEAKRYVQQVFELARTLA